MPLPPSHLGLHHVAIRVEDLEAARRFYVELLGYKVEWSPDADNLYLTCGNDNLALHRGEAPTGSQQLDHLGILVSNAEDVTQWEVYLRENNVEIAQGTKLHRDGSTSCYVRDPAGILIQILHHPPISPVLSGNLR